MAHIRVTIQPLLREGVLIAAFKGWNDAGDAATSAARFLVRRWGARSFATIDAEEFFDFSETRPHVRYGRDGNRVVDWPNNELFYRRGVVGGRDAVLLVGTEPNLRWKTFVGAILELCDRLNVTGVVTLGGLLADVPHSRPARITASSTDTELTEKIRGLNLHGSRYEGPTGIVGVLNTMARDAGLVATSLWGNVPHYVTASPNPKVTAALLCTLDELYGLELDLSELEATVGRFEAQVDKVVSENPEIAAYVAELERAAPREQLALPPPDDLPSGEAIVRELEEFLRRQRPSNPPDA